jgi:Rab GDP dissociation inhibitor
VSAQACALLSLRGLTPRLSYLQRPARETYDRILLYTSSMARYGKSPYIYPLYGLGELPQGFARLSAIYGGTYMLDKQVDEIVVDAETGKFSGVRCGDETVHADMVIGDPSYFRAGVGEKKTPLVRETAKVVRAICFLKHPIPNTDNADSVQLIIPQNQVGRKHDIYVACLSSAQNICANGLYVAQVSTIVESSTPELGECGREQQVRTPADPAATELKPGLDLLGPIYEKCVTPALR